MAKSNSPIFRTQYDIDSSKYVSESGSKTLDKYALRVNQKTV